MAVSQLQSTTTFTPLLNKVYTFSTHSLLLLQSGLGIFQVDFKNYNFPSGKTIFLSPGQYFQLLSGQYTIARIDFPNFSIQQTQNSRYLFKHLVSLGYVDLNQNPQGLHFFDTPENSLHLLQTAIGKWQELNPFNASPHEIDLLFDLKDIVDDRYREPISLPYVAQQLKQKEYRVKALAKEKLNSTVNKFIQNKLLLEAKRQVIFTPNSTKEIAYQLGFTNPNYFNRFFKLHTKTTPHDFRHSYTIEHTDTFITDIQGLINTLYKKQHTLAYYAAQLNIAPKTLAKKLNTKMGTTLHQILKNKLIAEAKALLATNAPINSIAYELGFNEPAHFTAFFKTATGQTPTQYKEHC